MVLSFPPSYIYKPPTPHCCFHSLLPFLSPFHSLSLVLPTLTLTPHLFYMSLLYVTFPSSSSSSLFSPGLLFPPSFLLMSHQSSPQRSRTDQLTAVSASVLTWTGQHTNKWEWLSSDSPISSNSGICVCDCTTWKDRFGVNAEMPF